MKKTGGRHENSVFW